MALQDGGGRDFTSSVSHDKVFWRQVEGREIEFGDGDALEVDLHRRVTRDPGTDGLDGELAIVNVISRVPPARQFDLLGDTSP